jgi:hypothetical protein
VTFLGTSFTFDYLVRPFSSFPSSCLPLLFISIFKCFFIQNVFLKKLKRNFRLSSINRLLLNWVFINICGLDHILHLEFQQSDEGVANANPDPQAEMLWRAGGVATVV